MRSRRYGTLQNSAPRSLNLFILLVMLLLWGTSVWLSETRGPYMTSQTFSIRLPENSSSSTFSSTELACLSQVIYAEARGEPLEGQLAVAVVALNRTVSGRFNPRGKSLCSVVHEKNQFAYSNRTNATTNMIAELATEQYGLVSQEARQWHFFHKSHHGTKIGAHYFI